MPFIQFELKRDGSGYKESRSLENALVNVVECDLAFGGQLTTFEQDKIVTETKVMGVTDISTYEGAVEDMDVLYRAGVVYLHLDSLMARSATNPSYTEDELRVINRAFSTSKEIFKAIGGINSIGHIFIGAGRAKQIYMGMLQPQSEKELMDLCSKSLKDIRALVGFKLIEKVSEEDFRALAYA